MTAVDLAITGAGLVLPCGDGFEAARAAWASKTPAFADLPEALGPGRGAACTAFNPAGIIPPMQLRRLDRPSRFAWVATHHAFADAGLDPKVLGDRMAVAVGTNTGGSEASEAFMRPYFAKGPEGASPMVFPNCVANAPSGHVALAFGLKGPSTSQLDRENACFSALEQARWWLEGGLADAVLVIGVDGLFPMLVELLQRTRLAARHGDPKPGEATGLLPGEGAQAFVVERASAAQARGARIRARIHGLAWACGPDDGPSARRTALARAAAEALEGRTPAAWIAGSNGHPRLDLAEARLGEDLPGLPAPDHPKALWGELCGSGGQLLAAALLESPGPVLVTAPASFGAQAAALLEVLPGA
jgi:3-oxoacyl-[acyl-carrier-protein] synthase II